MFSHKIPTEELIKYGLDEQTVRGFGNWLNGWAQRVVTGGMKSSWRPVTSSIPQRSVLSTILFNILLSNQDDG